jgi:VWFA-related protein
MPSRPTVLGVFFLAASAAVSLRATQEQPAGAQQPTFRGSIQSVRVDLYATHDGKPVTDLRRDEIQVFEDGTQQSIQNFEQISFAAPAGTGKTAPSGQNGESGEALTNPRSRLFVVFVPGRSTSPTASVLTQLRVPLIRHVNSLLGPDDLVAVMTPDTRIGDLKFYRRLPADARTWFEELPDDPRHTLWDICYPSYVPGSPNAEMKARLRELLTFEALDALIAYLGDVREERKHVLLLSDGFRQYYRNPKLGVGVIDEGRNQAGPSGVTQRPGDTTASVSPRQCESDLADLGSLEHASRLDEIGAHARRNNVAFYPIYPAGLNPPNSNRGRGFGGANFKNRSPSERQSALKELAEDTGGVPILNTKDIEGHLDKVMTATSAYYLIGYSPTNTTVDGRYRRISVKVSRPGIQVRARHGYVALPPIEARALPLIDTSRAPVPIEVAMGPLSVARSTAVNVRTASWTRGTGSGASISSLWVVAEVEPQFRPRSATTATAELTLRPVRGGQTISRRIDVGSDGSLVFDLQDDASLAAGDYSMQLALTSGGDEPVGEFGRLSVSSAQSPLGEALILRRGVATAQRYVRTADLRFQRTDRLRLELSTDAPGTPSAVLRDRRGAALPVPVQLNDRPDESGAFRWIVVDVPLISLAPGDYAVEVTHAGASRMTAFRLTP